MNEKQIFKDRKKYLSKCCNALVRIEFSDLPDFIGDKNLEIGTCNYICKKCNKPCDIIIEWFKDLGRP